MADLFSASQLGACPLFQHRGISMRLCERPDMNHAMKQTPAVQTNGPAIRILTIAGLLAASAVGTANRACAQTPAGQLPAWRSFAPVAAISQSSATPGGENRLQILGYRTLPYGSPGTLRLVQDSEPSQAEPIGPGAAQGSGSALPPSAPLPSQGNYEQIDAGWKPIGAVSASITLPAGELPANLAAPRFAQAGVIAAPINQNHDWPTLAYSWQASAVGHNPLYFEDVNLERYGYSRGILQPFISGGRFFTTVVLLPYKVVAHRPSEIIYPLGYYRPGDPAPPPVREIEPIKLTATAAETAFIIGMIIILP
jgi:hypothetical protein